MHYLRYLEGKKRALNLASIKRQYSVHPEFYEPDSRFTKIAVRTRTRCSCAMCKAERYTRKGRRQHRPLVRDG